MADHLIPRMSVILLLSMKRCDRSLSTNSLLYRLKEIFATDKRVEVSDFEIRQNRAVRSIETVSHFKTLYQKIYFIIGADNLASLKKWHRFEELDALVTWLQ